MYLNGIMVGQGDYLSPFKLDMYSQLALQLDIHKADVGKFISCQPKEGGLLQDPIS